MGDIMPIEQAEFIDNLQRWFNESTNMCHEDCYRLAFIVWQHKDYLSKVLGADERAKALDEILTQLTEAFDDNDNINVMYLKSYLQQLKEQK